MLTATAHSTTTTFATTTTIVVAVATALTDDVDDAVESRSRRRIYRTLVVVQWAENCLSLVMAAYFLSRTKRTSLIHPNLRILMTWSLVVPFNVLMIARMGQQINESTWWSKWVLGGSLPLRNSICVAFRLLHDTTIGITAIAIPLIAAERFAATLFRRTYEMHGQLFGVVIVCVAYGATFSTSVSLLVYDVWVTGLVHVDSTDSCLTVYLHPRLLICTWVVAIVTCYSSTLILILLYKWNVRSLSRNTGDESLQVRFQYKQNVTTMRAIVPAILPYCLLVPMGIGIAIYTVHAYDLGEVDTNRGWSDGIELNFQIMYMLADAYGITFKWVFLMQYTPLRCQLRNDLRRLVLCGDKGGGDDTAIGVEGGVKCRPRFALPRYETDPRAVAELYFNQLHTNWRQHPQKA